jgi:diacylglycerol O-acyltransferase
VERLSGLDASFLYTESPTVHMHTLKIGVIDPAGAPGGYSFERFVEVLDQRLHLLPPFRRRPVNVPYGLHHPVWVEDAAFDIRRHVRRLAAAEPGGSRELDAVISEVASTPLPRDRPLWEICVVEGLADGRVGFVAKLHHAMADGVAASQLLLNIMALSAETSLEAPPTLTRWTPEPVPDRSRLLRDALRDIGFLALALPALIVRTLVRLVGVQRLRRASDTRAPVAFQGRATSFNSRLTSRRAFASCDLPLADFLRVKSAFDVTVNDVVLACVSGAVREVLEAGGEPVDRPLVAAVPVSSDDPAAVRLIGNRTSNLMTSLPIDVADPVERLRATGRVASAAKELQNALGVETMEQWVEYSPPAAYRLIWRAIVPRVRRPPINAIVSNVPGPRDPLYIAGAELVELCSVGPLLEGVGLNVTVWSYCGSMFVSVLCCPDTLPDPHAVTDGFERALGELLAAIPA